MSEPHLSCHAAALSALLRNELQAEESEAVIDHLEHCTDCQHRLRGLVAPDAEWNHALALISACGKRDADDAFCSVPAFETQAVAWTESMSKQLLEPPRHPEMLGRLGRYEVERLIGSGGMGVVFKAFDTDLNRPVAIKLLAPYLATSGPARQRFSREARAAAAVVHQHVVPIHNVETQCEVPFFVMQYVSGESLQARIDREGALELCEILRIGMQVADGLAAAHQQGLVHRDIKPSNILLEEGVDRSLISDFGLARAVDDSSLTRTGFHPGTPQYMSPEQASGQIVDARSDLFSLGSMLYTMCTGRPPFRAENSLSVMRRISESEPTPIRELNPNIPEWMGEVIAKLMKKDVQDRLSSAAELRGLLEACLSHIQQPLSRSLPALPWIVSPASSHNACIDDKGWPKGRAFMLGGSLLAAILLLPFLRTALAPVQQATFSAQDIAAENDGLSHEVRSRLEMLVNANSLVVVGKLQEGKPTGDAYCHLFEASQILKGRAAKLQVILSHKSSVDPDDPILGRKTDVDLPRLPAGEYLLMLRAEELASSDFKPINPLAFLFEQEPYFNYFVSRDAEKHAAWEKGSPEEKYIVSLFGDNPVSR